MLRYYANLKAIRYKSTSLNRIVADRSQGPYCYIMVPVDETLVKTKETDLSLILLKLRLGLIVSSACRDIKAIMFQMHLHNIHECVALGIE